MMCSGPFVQAVKHTCPGFRASDGVQARGQSRRLRVKDRLACGGTAILVLNLCLSKNTFKKQQAEGVFCFTFHFFELAGHP